MKYGLSFRPEVDTSKLNLNREAYLDKYRLFRK